jgi:hypothetical protein
MNLEPLSEGITPPAERPQTYFVEVNGRHEHEAMLNDVEKMLELGLDPFYERMVYLKRWGSYLNE